MLKAGEYTQLAPVLFGSGMVGKIGEKAKELEMTKAILVTDKGIMGVGHHKKIMQSLEEAGVSYVLWGEARGECPVDSIRAAAAVARRENADGVIGLGGGSSLDTAKAVAVVAANRDEVLDDIPAYLNGDKHYSHKPIPSILVPTTAGTGSECTFVAVVNDPRLNCKIGLPSPPTYAIIDPALAVGTPPFITAFSGMDALTHAYESFTSKDNTTHSDLLAHEAMRLIMKWLPVACKDIDNLEARENLALASNFAGIAFSESMVHIGHAVGHLLGHLYNIPHGVGCAIVMPAIIEYVVARDLPERVKSIGCAMGIEVKGDDPKEIGKAVADALRAMMRDVGIPSLQKSGLTKEQTLALAEQVVNDPFCEHFAGSVTQEDIAAILEATYDKYQ